MRAAIFKGSNRLEAFSDGVFAIALTLLALEIHVPPAEQHETLSGLAAALWRGWPSYLALLVSFATILIAWVGHHLVVQYLRRSNWQVIMLNGLFLLCVTLLPFTTALVAEHLTLGGAPVALLVYGGLNVCCALAFAWLVRAVRSADAEDTPALVAVGRRALWSALILLGTPALAFWSPLVSLLAILAVWLWWGWPRHATDNHRELN